MIKAADIFAQIELPYSKGNLGRYSQNAVVRHLTDHFSDAEYDTAKSLVSDLRMAHWAAGSFGLIYDHELDEFLDCRSRRYDVEDIVQTFNDWTDEKLDGILRCSDLLIFALDFAANRIADEVEHYLEQQAEAA